MSQDLCVFEHDIPWRRSCQRKSTMSLKRYELKFNHPLFYLSKPVFSLVERELSNTDWCNQIIFLIDSYIYRYVISYFSKTVICKEMLLSILKLFLFQLILQKELHVVYALSHVCGQDRTLLAGILLKIFLHERLESLLLRTLNDREISMEGTALKHTKVYWNSGQVGREGFWCFFFYLLL